MAKTISKKSHSKRRDGPGSPAGDEESYRSCHSSQQNHRNKHGINGDQEARTPTSFAQKPNYHEVSSISKLVTTYLCQQ